MITQDTDSHLVTYLNPYSYTVARTHLDLFARMHEIRMDGILLCKVCNLFLRSGLVRRSFDNTADAPLVFGGCEQRRRPLYVVGSTETDVQGFVSLLRRQYPALPIAGFRNGYFEGEVELAATLSAITTSSAGTVLVGMGVGKQEAFLVGLVDAGWRGEGYTCGGFIHQTSNGEQAYYPDWVNRFNLRFFWRLYREPHFRPRVVQYLKFLYLFPFDWLRDLLGIKTLVTVLRERAR